MFPFHFLLFLRVSIPGVQLVDVMFSLFAIWKKRRILIKPRTGILSPAHAEKTKVESVTTATCPVLGGIHGAIVGFDAGSDADWRAFHVLQLLGAVVLPKHHLRLESPRPMLDEPKAGRRVGVAISPQHPTHDHADQNQHDQDHHHDTWGENEESKGVETGVGNSLFKVNV